MTEEPLAGISNTISGGNQYGPVLQGRYFDVTVRSAAAAPVAIGQLPPQAAGFTGRDDELRTIVGLLDPVSKTGTVLVSAVAGLAGVGKTALAIAAGHAALERGWYRGGVLFTDLHGYDESAVQPSQALDALLRDLGVPAEHIPSGSEARSGLYRSMLAQVNEPILIIVDNASSEAQVRPLLPGAGPHRVVVTSRHTLAGLDARLLDVTVLDNAASVKLLETALRAARPDDDRISRHAEAALQLARMCGGLPLALQIVAALLKADPSFTVSEMAGELAAEHQRLELLQYDDGSGTGTPSVAAAFGLSYKQLDEKSARVFRMLPFNPGPDVATATAAVLAELPPRHTRTALADLTRAHLIEPTPGMTGRWRMHDLVRLYAHRLGNSINAKAAEQARNRLLVYYSKMTKAAVIHLLAYPGVEAPDCFIDRNAAITWLDEERLNLAAAPSAAMNFGKNKIAFDLSLNIAEYFSWQHYVDEWLHTAAVGLTSARDLGDREKEAGALNNQGLALQAAKRFGEAATAHQTAADIYQELNIRRQLGMALHNLGMALADQCRFDEAIEAYNQDLAICRAVGDRYGEAMTLNSITNCLHDMKRFKDAVTTGNDALAIWRKLGDRHGEAIALNNFFGCLAKTGRFSEAVAAGRRAVDLLEETGDKYRGAKALVSLSAILYDAGNYDESLAISEKAVAASQEIGDRNGEGRALSNIAGNLLKLSRGAEAIAADQAALDIFRETGDKYHEGVILNNLGIALRDAQRFDQAIEVHQTAAAILLEIEEKDQAGDALNNLAVDLGMTNRFNESIAASRRAVSIFQGTGNLQGEAIANYNQGNSNHGATKDDLAIKNYQSAVSIYKRIGDKAGEGSTLLILAPLLGQAKRIDESITVSERAIHVCREIGDLYGTGIALLNFATGMRLAEQFDKAVTASRSALSVFQEVDDKENELRALINLSSALRATGKTDEAETVRQQGMAILAGIGDIGFDATRPGSPMLWERPRESYNTVIQYPAIHEEPAGISRNRTRAAQPSQRRDQPRRQTRRQRTRRNKGNKH